MSGQVTDSGVLNKTIEFEEPLDHTDPLDHIDPLDFVNPVDEDEFQAGKIYCANCIKCKLIAEKHNDDEHYVLRIRCSAGKWKKKLGEEKVYKYCTITRRYCDECDAYEPMGECRGFMKDLKKSLPNKDELYNLHKIV